MNIESEIEKLVPTLHGWSTVEKTYRLAMLAMAINSNVSVELGVYAGKSFIGFALAHKWMANGVAYAVDPWNNTAAADGYVGENKTFWENNPLELIYGSFIDLLKQTETASRVKVIRDKSDNISPPGVIDVLHVDGSHTEQAVRDVRRFAANVRCGGFCVMDDIAWSNDSDEPVKRAVVWLENNGFVQLYPLGTGAVYQRVK